MSVVSELAERFPSADGGLRRRFLSGLLFLFVTSIGVFWFPSVPLIASFIIDRISISNIEWSLTNSITMTIILSAIIFIIGNLIDVIGYVFLNRIFFFLGGTLVYRRSHVNFDNISSAGTSIRETRGTSKSLPQNSSYGELPRYVQIGLRNPYSRQFEVSMRFLLHIAPDDEKIWLQQLDSRNKNIFAILSSMFLAVVLVSFASISSVEVDSGQNLSSQKARSCYTSFVNDLREKGLIIRTTRREALRDLEQENPDTLWHLNRFLNRVRYVIGEGIEDSRGIGDSREERKLLLHRTIENLQLVDLNNDAIQAMVNLGDLEELEDYVDAKSIEYQKCKNMPASDYNMSQRPVQVLFVTVLSMMVILLFLSVTYALILRNSVANILEMMWLRNARQRTHQGETRGTEGAGRQDHTGNGQ